VKIDNFSFGPVTLTVPVRTTVTWINRDDIPHTVGTPWWLSQRGEWAGIDVLRDS